jgi:uncharacterized OB-fold protein
MPSTTTELWSENDDSVVLNGFKCGGCGMVLFPPQRYGCPGCGALPEMFEPKAIPAVGRLHSYAVVNRHPKYPTPYTVGEIELDAGPLVRGILADGQPLALNARMAAHSEEVDGNQVLVFAPAEEK